MAVALLPTSALLLGLLARVLDLMMCTLALLLGFLGLLDLLGPSLSQVDSLGNSFLLLPRSLDVC